MICHFYLLVTTILEQAQAACLQDVDIENTQSPD